MVYLVGVYVLAPTRYTKTMDKAEYKMLVDAVQVHQDTIKELTARVEALERRNDEQDDYEREQMTRGE